MMRITENIFALYMTGFSFSDLLYNLFVYIFSECRQSSKLQLQFGICYLISASADLILSLEFFLKNFYLFMC